MIQDKSKNRNQFFDINPISLFPLSSTYSNPMKKHTSKPKPHLQPIMRGICKEIYRMLLRRVEQNKIVYKCIKPNI